MLAMSTYNDPQDQTQNLPSHPKLVHREESAMPIVVQYDNDQRSVIRYEFIGNWTWSDYSQAIKEAHKLAESLPHVANLILDFSRGSSFPSYAMSNFGSSWRTLSQKFRSTVIVSNSLYIEVLVKVFQRMSNIEDNKIVLVRTLADAYQLLADDKDQCA
jgi:hypothetical protein